MSELIQTVSPIFFQTHLDMGQLFNQLEHISMRGAEYVDLFFQKNESEVWRLEDGQVTEGGHDLNAGVAIHATQRASTGFAYSETIDWPSIQNISRFALGALNQPSKIKRSSQQYSKPPKRCYPTVTQGHLYPAYEKIELLRSIDQHVRSLSDSVDQVLIKLSVEDESMLLLNNLNQCCADQRPMIRMDVTAILSDRGQREQGHIALSGRYTWLTFIEQLDPKKIALEVIRLAKHGFKARPAPAGVMPVVLGPGWPGILLHEAVGHGLEGDFNRQGSSAFSNKLGQHVASKVCTVIDDGTLPHARGSLVFDDEGVPGQRNILIENGVLKGYLFDRLNAELMGMSPTGNGRRASYADPPLPRMTNTFLNPGAWTSQEILNDVDYGVYCVNFSGGQVDITSGKFVFSANEAYLIEGGKIKCPIQPLTLIGDGPSVLKKVSMVGSDWALDPGLGVCGKEGQSVPVGVGQPTIKIDEMVVGGSQVSAKS